jgi:hypothetical protein
MQRGTLVGKQIDWSTVRRTVDTCVGDLVGPSPQSRRVSSAPSPSRAAKKFDLTYSRLT